MSLYRRVSVSKKRRLWSVTLGALAVVVTSATASGQVAPIGGHQPTLGDGNGHNAPASPTGGFGAAVPLDLPSSRSGLPAPLQIRYTGSARAGAAGAGWDIPLSYVRLSTSERRRKPSVENDGTLANEVPPRLFVALDGNPVLMVPSDTAGTYLPFAADGYMELRESGSGWTLEVLGGIRYRFEPVASLGSGALTDPGLWLLTRIEDPVRVDRVELEYDIAPVACGTETSPEVNVSRIRHTFDDDSTSPTPLYEIRVGYRGWEMATTGAQDAPRDAQICAERQDGLTTWLELVLGTTEEAGYETARRRIVDHVSVQARNNVADTVTALREVARFDLQYEEDPDTGLPRLHRVYTRGEPDVQGPASIPLVGYEYGAFDGGYAAPVVIPRSYTSAQGGDYAGLYASALSSTDVEVEDFEVDGGLAYGLITARRETVRTRHVLRDFTGDGLPDLAFKVNGGWTLYVNRTTDAGTQLDFGTPYTWSEPKEIFEQTTFEFTGDYLKRPDARRAMKTTETWVQYLDWNGDGRLDVVDARRGTHDYYWRVWINEGVSGGQVHWRAENVFIDPLRPSGVDPEHPFWSLQDELNLVTGYHIQLGDDGRFPLERSKSWPRVHEVTCNAWIDPEGDGLEEVSCGSGESYIEQSETDTYVEWRLADVNGDGYPDFVANREPVLHCELDYINEGWRYPEGVFVRIQDKYQFARDGRCPSESAPPPAATEHDVFVNIGGALFPAWAHEGSVFRSRPKRPGNVGHWVNGEPSWSPTAWTFDPGPSAEHRGFADPEATGISTLQPTQTRFDSDRWEVCPGAPASQTYSSRQVEGLIDLNGDGLPDRVYLTSSGWKMRLGRGVGWGRERSLSAPGGFELSLTEGTCAGTTRTVAGLQDLDGDGKPELLRIVDGQLTASQWFTSDGTPGHAVGRLTAIDNLQGAVTRITYANNKRETSTPHDVPYPEIVVAQVHVDLEDPAAQDLVPTQYAYGTAQLVYDPVLARWSFAGYDRTVAVTGRGCRGCAGVAVITDRSPAAPPGTGFEARLLAGRVVRTTRLEDSFFQVDPRQLLTVDVTTDPRARAGATIEYDVVELPSATGGGDGEECFDADGATGAYPLPDYALCRRAGIVVAWSTAAWEGTHAPPALDNVWSGSYVETFDPIGRPTRIVQLGDVRRYDDDTCTDIYYAVPTGPSARLLDAPSSMWVTDCGWNNPNHGSQTPGPEEIIAGARMIYDGLPEGSVSAGRVTRTIAERFGPSGHMGTFVVEDVEYDAAGRPWRFYKTRTSGSSALQSTELMYDRYGASVLQTVVSADDVDVDLVRTTERSVWPSVPVKVTEPGGETFVTVRDSIGRPIEDRLEPVGGGSFVQTRTTYDDTPGARAVTTYVFQGTTPVGTDTSAATRWTSQRAELDALGRTVFAQQFLGADYPGQSLVKRFVQYDEWGRESFAAAPFTWSDATFDPDLLSNLPYGTSFYYDSAGRLINAVSGPGRQPASITSSAAQDIYPTAFQYLWEDGLAIQRVLGPSELASGHPAYGAWDETRTTASGRTISTSRHLTVAARIDHVERTFDRLGRPYAVRRFKDAQTATGVAEWITPHDSLGNQLEVIEPGTAPVVTSYDEWGAPFESVWTEGGLRHVTRWTYDGLGRLTERRVFQENPGTTPATVTEESREFYYYDAHSADPAQPASAASLAGRLSWSEAPGRAASFYAYDAMGRRTSTTVAHADERMPVRTRQVYSASGVVDQITFEAGGTVESALYDYDSAGMMTRVRYFDGSSLVTLLDAVSKDAKGRYRELELGNGVRESFAYQPAGREEPMSWIVDTASDVRTFTYDAFDPEMRLQSATERVLGSGSPYTPPDVRTYQYDARDRLVNASLQGTGSFSHSYQYDGLGNILRAPQPTSSSDALYYEHTDPDRLTRTKKGSSLFNSLQTRLHYDAIGNVVSEQRISGTASFTPRHFTYDSSSRIRSMQRGSWNATFDYGANGELLKEELRYGGSLDREIRHYGPLIRKRTRSGGASAFERSVPGPVGVVASVRGEGATRSIVYLHGDGRGNRIFTNASGSVVQTADYFPYGKVRTQSGTPSSQDYTDDLFNGGADYYTAFGVTVLGARIYDPDLGRFLQRDPIAYAGSSTRGNPYTFAFGDPINHIDPTGLTPNEWIAAASEAVAESATAATAVSTGLSLALSLTFSIDSSGPSGAITGVNGGTAGIERILDYRMPVCEHACWVDNTIDFAVGVGDAAVTLAKETALNLWDMGGLAGQLGCERTGWCDYEHEVRSAVGKRYLAGDSKGEILWDTLTAPVQAGKDLIGGIQTGNYTRAGHGAFGTGMSVLGLRSAVAAVRPRTTPAPPAPPKPPNRIYSTRELMRRAEEPGPYHNFPESFNAEIFNGTRTVTPDFYRTPKPGLSNDSVMYTARGSINGRAGTFEIAVRPSKSGRTEVIIHRFFRPDKK